MKIYPVVHVNNIEQSLEQSELAFSSGADGVFLIDHHGHGPETLVLAYNSVRERFPEQFIGLNFLGVPDPVDVYTVTERLKRGGAINKAPDALWVDDARGDITSFDDPVSRLEVLAQNRSESDFLKNIKFFGGTAFKYTIDYTDDPVEAAVQANQNEHFIDVITTSGEGTGKAASLEKIRSMKAAIGNNALALASGVDANNINSYKPYVDYVLVSTSVEVEPYSGIFDPARLKELIDLAHE